MDFNYTLRYKTFNSLIEEVKVDLRNFNLQGMIDPAELIKVARWVTYDLGLRVYQTKEVVLDIERDKVKIPSDFFVMNFALLCGHHTTETILASGTHVEDIKGPLNNDFLVKYKPFLEPEVCGDANTCCVPKPFIQKNCCLDECGGEISVVQTFETHKQRHNHIRKLRFVKSNLVDCDCPNLKWHGDDEASIKDGYIWLYNKHKSPHGHCFEGKIYINYQGIPEDDEGNLLVVDHEKLNEFYEYALKRRILENLLMAGESVQAQMQLVEARYRSARIDANKIVNMPNFSEMQKTWESNRKAFYGKYYQMFSTWGFSNNYRSNNAL